MLLGLCVPKVGILSPGGGSDRYKIIVTIQQKVLKAFLKRPILLK